MSDANALPASINFTKLDQPKIRLAYLEGIRGLAAIYVVLFHVYQECTARREMPSIVLSAMKFIAYPQGAVAIFIVLSGYCLMLPVVQSGKDYISGGMLNYLKRRSRRILPPYYAALFISLLLLAVTLTWQHFTGFHWDTLSMGFRPGIAPSLGAILSHILLVHNWHLDWVYAINSPMWSVATEWQIYFLFPLLLLPVYRYFGIIAAVAIAFVVGIGPCYLWPKWPNYTVSPWFLGLFALGMLGAWINFSQKPLIIRWRRMIPWGVLTAILWISLIASVAPYPVPLGVSKEFACWIGAATVSLLIYCTHFLTDGNAKRRPLILQVFNTHYILTLGTFSYSLYLMHTPVIVLVHQFLLSQHLSPAITFLILLIVAVPLAILISYIFHLSFEKPFMSSHRKAA